MNSGRLKTTGLLALIVCPVAGCVGGWFGMVLGDPFMASMRFSGLTAVGLTAGGIGGIIVGILWCWIIAGQIGRPNNQLWLTGAKWGVIAGVLDTLALHIIMGIVSDFNIFVLFIGLGLGTVAGFVTGSICGEVCRFISRRWVAQEGEAQ